MDCHTVLTRFPPALFVPRFRRSVGTLVTHGKVGIPSLYQDGIPLAHYYDGDSLYFRLGLTAGSTKREFYETTEMACYVLYGAEPTDDPRGLDSWSIIVTGQLVELPETEHERFDTAEINRHFSPIRVFDEAIEDIDITVVKLDIDTITGRHTPAQDHG